MLKQTKAKLKKVIRLEMRRLLELYALEPFDAKEAERSMRIIKAAVDTLLRLEKQTGEQKGELNIKIELDE